MVIKETIDLMLSESATDRLTAEYWQTKTRTEKLDVYIAKAEAGEIEAKDSIEVLKAQGEAMHSYLYFLEMRMKMNGLLESEEV